MLLEDGFADCLIATFGSDMGALEDGTEVGKKLMRGSWNARPYGPLYDAQIQGVESGTDLYFHKSEFSSELKKVECTLTLE